VLSNPQPVAEAVKRVSPDTLIVLDAVCAVASEEIQMDNWGIDVVITASQKGLGAPPGLSIVVVSEKALKVEHFSCRAYHRELTGFTGLRDALETDYRVLCELEEASVVMPAPGANIYLSADGFRL
jgi:selenocysteine lyase/cysteine desulfurase